jgi:hypothetical protein
MWPLTMMAWLSLVLAACGSGDLGKVVGDVNIAPPPAAVAPVVIDAGHAQQALPEPAVCGDGVLQISRGEQCDGNDFGGRTCSDLMLGSGALGCDPSTCRFLTSQCVPDAGNPPAPLDAPDASTVDASAPEAAQCPTGFACGTSIFETMQPLCMQWGEDGPPLCLQAGSNADCNELLAGSTCTKTMLGSFCMLPCSL